MAFTNETLQAMGQLLARYTAGSKRADVLRSRWELIERYFQRSVDTSSEGAQGKAYSESGRRDKHRNLELPIVLQQVETAHADLVGTFCTGYPIFGFVGAQSAPDAPDVALMLSTLCERDQERFGWVSNMQRALRDALLKDVFAVEVTWERKQGVQLATDGKQVVTKTVRHEGNRLRRLCPYNLIFDATTPLEEMAEYGAYVGYVERKNYIRVKSFLQELPQEHLIKGNISAALSNAGTSGNGLYYIPDLHPLEATRSPGEPDWEAFFGAHSRNARASSACGRYEVVTLYVRLIPEEFGIRGARAGTPSPFKLVWIGDVLVYAEPLTYAHGMLPVALSHLTTTGLGFENRSFAENLLDMQDVGTSMMNGVIASMRRAVSDRAIYNPLLLDPRDVASANPAAKMALKPAAFQLGIDSAYKAIPYEDRLTPYLASNMQTVLALSNNVTGLNPAAQGSFVKGNKTREEFSQVMSNSDARMRRSALDIESNGLAQLKYMLKLNYMQFAQLESIFSRSQERAVQIEPAALIAGEADFKAVDGVMPAAKVASTDALVAAYNTLAQAPDLDAEYSRGDIFAALLKAQGVDIGAFRRSPEERQARMQQAAAAQQAGGQAAGVQ